MHTQPRMYKRAILCNTLQSYLSKNSYTNTNQMSLNNPSSRLLLLDVLALLLIACILPIPVRSQSYAVQFPTSTASCVTCMPAFATAPCQTILNSIGQSSNGSISTSILAECQCTGTFLTLYSSCVQCFTETDQLEMVFGSNQAPSSSSLDTYCKALSRNSGPLGTTTVTKTVTRTTTTTMTATGTSLPTNPSSATTLKVYQEGQPMGAVTMCTVVAGIVLAYFPVLA